MAGFSLEPITVFEAPPPDLVAIARASGCSHVGLWVQSPVPGIAAPPLAEDAALARRTRQRLADDGIAVHNIECFNLALPDAFDGYRRTLEVGARLGGRVATCIAYGEPDLGRLTERFARLAALAAEMGLRLAVEFISMGDIRTLADAVRVVRGSGAGNGGITVDLLHLVRTGAGPADVAALDPRLIAHVQLCDGPASMPPDRLAFEGTEQRRLPGDGVFPIREFVAAVPPGLPLGIEVPLKDLRDAGVGPGERARRATDALKALIGAV
jgi:sugar phosphate isomerase/epimerase